MEDTAVPPRPSLAVLFKEEHVQEHNTTRRRADVLAPGAPIPSQADEYLFDLRGYLLIRGLLTAEEVAEGNALVDEIPLSMPSGDWFGNVHKRSPTSEHHVAYHQIYELGGIFLRLIDHDRVINYMRRFLGGDGTFDDYYGEVFLDSNFFTIRGRSASQPLHSGAHDRSKRTQFRYHNDNFQCGQINLLVAFSDVGPGDGATRIIPGSHKSNVEPPGGVNDFAGHVDHTEHYIVDAYLRAGDALMFVDSCTHGAGQRVNHGERRVAIYRYSSAWNRASNGYMPSEDLLARLNPFARRIVMPDRHPTLQPPPRPLELS